MRTIRVTVRGLVQGVGFRYFALQQANALGLVGTVRNLPDGRTVEVVAQGSEPDIQAYVEDLTQGPPGGYVESVDVQDVPAAERMFRFRIIGSAGD
jgi:acylphosphatase